MKIHGLAGAITHFRGLSNDSGAMIQVSRLNGPWERAVGEGGGGKDKSSLISGFR